MPPTKTFVLRNRHFFALDAVTIGFASLLSFMIRMDFPPSFDRWQGVLLFWSIALPVHLLIFAAFGLYRHYWYNAGVSELVLITTTVAIATLVTAFVTLTVLSSFPVLNILLPRSIPLINGLIVFPLVVGTRFSQRALRHRQQVRTVKTTVQEAAPALIVGAGYTGVQMLDVLRQAGKNAIVGFLDDDPAKLNTLVRGAHVIGKTTDLLKVVQQTQVKLVVVAMPSAPGTVIRRIVSDCRTAGIAYQTIPSIYELASGQISINTLRPVSIDDLLRRPIISLDVKDIQHQVAGACIMVTGAGGSIGSELTSQIAKYQPGCLLLVGHGENSLFAVEARIKAEFPNVRYHLLLADVRDATRMRTIFETWRPSIVFHAAAHKHVPMLETNVSEAVINNVVGTNNLIELCNQYEVDRMVMISSDKAVAPTNVMGMTKRVCEMLMMNAAVRNPNRFAAVRFGNVLGSRGSVVPTFQAQIAAGGPVTITDQNITRFFMSIPEAVRLVLKASVIRDDGALFVLNMGKPIRIVDLAHDLIRLSGLEPGRNIEIKFTGLRPGEKLYEELFWPYETQQPLEQGSIFAVQMPIAIQQTIQQQSPAIRILIDAALTQDHARVRELLTSIVFSQPIESSAETLLEVTNSIPEHLVIMTLPGDTAAASA